MSAMYDKWRLSCIASNFWGYVWFNQGHTSVCPTFPCIVDNTEHKNFCLS